MPTESPTHSTTPPLLLFDLDGTLIDSRGDLTTATNIMRHHYRLPPLSQETVSGYVGDGMRLLAARATKETHIPVDEATRILSEAYAQHLTEQTVPYPGVEETVRQFFEAGIPMGLITNKPSAHAHRLFDHFGWTRLFAIILGGGDTPELKPSPLPLQVAMQRLHHLPGTTWMVGDHHTDLEAARRASVRSIFLQSGIGQQGGETPTLILPDFAALQPLFLPLRERGALP